MTRALEPVVRARARALIEQIEAGTPLDVVQALSVPFPLLVISEILGVPEDGLEAMLRVVGGRDPRSDRLAAGAARRS